VLVPASDSASDSALDSALAPALAGRRRRRDSGTIHRRPCWRWSHQTDGKVPYCDDVVPTSEVGVTVEKVQTTVPTNSVENCKVVPSYDCCDIGYMNGPNGCCVPERSYDHAEIMAAGHALPNEYSVIYVLPEPSAQSPNTRL
jgi:hypothetical protein